MCLGRLPGYHCHHVFSSYNVQSTFLCILYCLDGQYSAYGAYENLSLCVLLVRVKSSSSPIFGDVVCAARLVGIDQELQSPLSPGAASSRGQWSLGRRNAGRQGFSLLKESYTFGCAFLNWNPLEFNQDCSDKNSWLIFYRTVQKLWKSDKKEEMTWNFKFFQKTPQSLWHIQMSELMLSSHHNFLFISYTEMTKIIFQLWES